MLNSTTLNRLDACQAKGFRKIFKRTTTFINRINTNRKIYEEVEEETGRSVKKLCDFHKERRLMLMAKLLIMGNKDPAAGAAFKTDTLEQHDVGKKEWEG